MSELLNKAFTLLSLLKPREGKKEWGAAELARLAGFNPATTHRILQDLQQYGFVSQNQESKKFFLGPALIELGFQAQSLYSIKDVARPFMEEIQNKTGESVYLNILVHSYEAMLIDSVDSDHQLRVYEPIGLRLPLHIAATRRAILAFMEPGEQEAYLSHFKIELRTPKTIHSKEALVEELSLIRERGYAVSFGETTLGTAGVAVPILGPRGVEGSLGIATPEVRLNDEKIAEYAELLKCKAKSIGALIGGS
ncbi:IclR family transcriptional regulator [Neobacillus sp. OS1-32]|uniref:IclR family transcriptional regulator n=1 Tax=Neobacillus sp. OS1-32 TaxID=3070682 RepID=UPI0027E142ED|nr:IclR family transcriptional regulator [Neobacillus sp. OS1-32]WML31431.1 IclR family transcriptional regulator [Neobacillus sp. OS1-32]